MISTGLVSCVNETWTLKLNDFVKHEEQYKGYEFLDDEFKKNS